MNSLKSCIDCLLSVLDGVPKDIQVTIADADISKMIASSGHGDIVLKEDDGIYEKGNTFKSLHRQASRPMSRKVLLAGFLSVWLKKCVISSPPHDEISSMAIFLAIQVVHGRALGLLPAMICSIQHGLRTLTETFCKGTPTKKAGKEHISPHDGPSLRVELS